MKDGKIVVGGEKEPENTREGGGFKGDVERYGEKQTYERNYSSSGGRTAGVNDVFGISRGGRKTVEQETSGVGDRSQGRKSGWRGHKMKPEAEGTAS